MEPAFSPYFARKNKLTIEKDCLLRGIQVVLPSNLHKKVLKLLHESHLGVVKMKALARSRVWWPGINKALEKVTKHCPFWWEDLMEEKRGLSQGRQMEHTKDLANQIFQTFQLPGAQVQAGGKPSLINMPSSLGTLICGEENSIGCRDVTCSHLVDKVKE